MMQVRAELKPGLRLVVINSMRSSLSVSDQGFESQLALEAENLVTFPRPPPLSMSSPNLNHQHLHHQHFAMLQNLPLHLTEQGLNFSYQSNHR